MSVVRGSLACGRVSRPPQTLTCWFSGGWRWPGRGCPGLVPAVAAPTVTCCAPGGGSRRDTRPPYSMQPDGVCPGWMSPSEAEAPLGHRPTRVSGEQAWETQATSPGLRQSAGRWQDLLRPPCCRRSGRARRLDRLRLRAQSAVRLQAAARPGCEPRPCLPLHILQAGGRRCLRSVPELHPTLPSCCLPVPHPQHRVSRA